MKTFEDLEDGLRVINMLEASFRRNTNDGDSAYIDWLEQVNPPKWRNIMETMQMELEEKYNREMKAFLDSDIY